MQYSFPFGALLRLAHAIQASTFNGFEEVCSLFMEYVSGEQEKATREVEEIWSGLLGNAFSTHGPYGHKGRSRKLKQLTADAIHLD